jgi:predicted nucleic acid-binding protein
VTERVHRGVLDTGVVIFLRRLRGSSALPEESLVSTVTLAELSVGPLLARHDEEQAIRLGHLQQADADFEALPFDIAAAHAFGRVGTSLRRHGRTSAARTYDAMIAATALANDLGVHTCNPDDFAGIDGLTVIAVPHPGPSAPEGRGAGSEEVTR